MILRAAKGFATKPVFRIKEGSRELKYIVLSEENRERIHLESLRVLAEVGVRFHSKLVLRQLELAGARIDYQNSLARIDRSMVEQALKTAPKEFTLGARNKDYDFIMPSVYTAYTLDGTASFAIDFSEGKNLFDDLFKVGPGGHFLDRESTFRLCRDKEFYQPLLHDKIKIEEMQEGSKTDLYTKAREKVTEILSGPVQNELSETVKTKLDDILIRATNDLI